MASLLACALRHLALSPQTLGPSQRRQRCQGQPVVLGQVQLAVGGTPVLHRHRCPQVAAAFPHCCRGLGVEVRTPAWEARPAQ